MWRCSDGESVAFFVADAPITTGCFVRLAARACGSNAAQRQEVAASAPSNQCCVLALGDGIGSVHFLDVPVSCS